LAHLPNIGRVLPGLPVDVGSFSPSLNNPGKVIYDN